MNGLDLTSLMAPPAPAASSTYLYGTITSTNPLRVHLDGDSAALSSTPVCLYVPTVNDRVYCQLAAAPNRQLVILGAVGGPVPDPSTYENSYTLVSADLTSPWQIRSGYTNTIYRSGNIVTLSWQFSTSGAFSSGSVVVAAGVLPSWCYPSGIRVLSWADSVAFSSTALPNAEMGTDGTLKAWAGSSGGAVSSTKIFGTYHI